MRIKNTRLNITLEILTLGILVGISLYLIIFWKSIPDQIAAHYNSAGEIDRMGSKSELLMLPIVSWIMYGLLTLVGHFPSVWNTGVKITQENKEKVYRTIKNMLSMMKFLMVAVFAYLTINSSSAQPLPGWALPLFLVVIFGMIGISIFKLFRAK